MRADSFIRTRWQPWVLGAARWPTLISCSPEWWSPGSPGYCRLSPVGACLVWKINTLTRAEVWSCTSSDMFISGWHTGFKGHHKSDILKWNNNIYAQIVCWWDHVEMVFIKLAYKWLPIYRQPEMPRLFTKCVLLTLFLPSKIHDQMLGFCLILSSFACSCNCRISISTFWPPKSCVFIPMVSFVWVLRSHQRLLWLWKVFGLYYVNIIDSSFC